MKTIHPPIKDGNVYSKLTVISFSHRDAKGRAYYHCSCSCGGEHMALGDALKTGQTKWCKAAVHRQHQRTHGASTSPEYMAWVDMKRRCAQSHRENYKYYGERGIKVHGPWRSSFEAFMKDVGFKPSPKHSLNRIDNNGNYEPGNVEWATFKEQSNNMRTNHLVEIRGETLSLSQVAHRYGFKVPTIFARFRYGYRGEDLIVPLKKIRQPKTDQNKVDDLI